MKQFKTSMLLVAMLMTIQTAIHADASNMQSPADNTERTWKDFLNQYKYHIAGAAAVGGAITLGYIYQDEFKDWFASLSPQKQEEITAEIQETAQQDAQDVQNIQEDVSEQLAQDQDAIDNQDASATTTKEIATAEAAIVEQLEEMKEKQQELSWFQRVANFLGSKGSRYTGNDPDRLAIQAEIDANNAPSDEDYRSSDFARDEDTDQSGNGKPAYVTTLGNIAYSSFLGKPNQAHEHIDKYYPSFKADFQSKANASNDSSSSNNGSDSDSSSNSDSDSSDSDYDSDSDSDFWNSNNRSNSVPMTSAINNHTGARSGQTVRFVDQLDVDRPTQTSTVTARAPQEIPMNQLITIEGQEVRDLDVPVDTQTANRESVAAGQPVIENNNLRLQQSINRADQAIQNLEGNMNKAKELKPAIQETLDIARATRESIEQRRAERNAQLQQYLNNNNDESN